jgi:hypothetical protein
MSVIDVPIAVIFPFLGIMFNYAWKLEKSTL